MDIYVLAIGILFLFAIMDLMVGVSNDAVNFLNSSVGSRVASRRVIMIVASLGIMAGVTFSSGMMEVARKGIFHPQFFLMPELIAIFLAVMITDVILLDLFNTFGLPTSTTVSIVFELLGAAVAVSIVKILQNDQSLLFVAEYINTGKALAIISGILLSVAISFVCGALAQFLTRLLFTFDYEKRVKKYGALWGGIALSMICYFILIKGAKGASFITAETVAWIDTHTWTILVSGFAVFTAVFQTLMWGTRINILKPVVLAGTFALAMAFAANDLVNFIGVPLAGLNAFILAKASGAPLTASMAGLRESVPTNTLYLLAAGAIMVVTLWFSRKARTVTKTEVNLGRQKEGFERFDSSQLSRIIVRMVLGLSDGVGRVVPASAKKWVKKRLNSEGYQPAPGFDGKVPEFDLLRASVNLMMASALVSLGTSMKLPLSTTYVTFMVAMGTSLADQAWGLESAVFRVTGVLTVIGGWFFTAFMAVTISMVCAFAIMYLDGVAIVVLIGLVAFLILRNIRIHKTREKDSQEMELLDLKRVTDAAFAVRISFENSGQYLGAVLENLSACFEGILTENRKLLKQLRRETSKMQTWSNIIVANIFKTLRLLGRGEARRADKYSYVVYALQEITESTRDMILRCHVHTSNHHAGLLPAQKKEIQQVRKAMESLLSETAKILKDREPYKYRDIAAHYVHLKTLVEECDRSQADRIRKGLSKTRLSILFYGINNACQKIGEQTLQLLTVFEEISQPDTTDGGDEKRPSDTNS